MASAADGSGGGTNVPWYLSRATGMVAYVLLFVSVMLGLAVRTKALDRLVARWRVTDVHIVLSVLVTLFVAVHIAALLGDTFIGFSVVQLLVPFASPYLPVWTGIGVITAYLLVIIMVSFPARRAIGYRAWRTLHYATFVVYVGALVHGLFTGTDTATGWAQAIYVVTAGCVLALLLYRVFAWSRRERQLIARTPAFRQPGARASAEVTAYLMRPLAAAVGPAAPTPAAVRAEVEERTTSVQLRALIFTLSGAGVALLLLVAAAAGPFHWLGNGGASAGGEADGSAPLSLAVGIPGGFTGSYSGTFTSATGRRATSFSLHAVATGERDVTLDVQLQTAPGFGGTTVTANGAALTDAHGVTLCTGTATALNGSGFDVTCDGAGPFAGRTLHITGTMQAGDGDRVQGTLVATVANGQA